MGCGKITHGEQFHISGPLAGTPEPSPAVRVEIPKKEQYRETGTVLFYAKLMGWLVQIIARVGKSPILIEYGQPLSVWLSRD